jgi:hypothetical protein
MIVRKLISWNRDVLEERMTAHVVTKRAFYGTMRFIPVFAKARQWSLS